MAEALPASPGPGDADGCLYRYALGWYGARMTARLRARAARLGCPVGALDQVASAFLADHERNRKTLRDQIR